MADLSEIFINIKDKAYDEINIETDLHEIRLERLLTLYMPILSQTFGQCKIICDYKCGYNECQYVLFLKTNNNKYYLLINHKSANGLGGDGKYYDVNTKQIIYFYKQCLMQMLWLPSFINLELLMLIN